MHDDWPFDPAEERYVSLSTYRRNGIEVATPVWIAESGGRYYLFSEGRAGKVKRLRLNKKARMASCDFRGKIRGNWLEARGRVVTDARTVETAYKALRCKYGWQMMVGDFFSKLSGRYDKRAIVELEVVA